jgi:hypothetical protein
MVFLVALLGLALASLVVLTPWHMSDLNGGAQHGAAVEKHAPGGGRVLTPAADRR